MGQQYLEIYLSKTTDGPGLTHSNNGKIGQLNKTKCVWI